MSTSTELSGQMRAGLLGEGGGEAGVVSRDGVGDDI